MISLVISNLIIEKVEETNYICYLFNDHFIDLFLTLWDPIYCSHTYRSTLVE